MQQANPDADALGARLRDVEIDQSTKKLSRTVLGQVPVVRIDGPQKVDAFVCNENDKDNPIRKDEIRPPYFVDEFRGQWALNFDLLHNFETFVRKGHNALDLGEKILWLEHQLKTHPGVPLKEVLGDVDFFTGRSVLKLMGSAPFTPFPWKLVAFKYHGVIFVFDIKPEHGTATDSLKHDYMGHKFHQYVTATLPTGKPDTDKPVNTYEKYGVMFRSSFECDSKRLSCLFSWKADGIDRDGNGVELRTEMFGLTPSKRLAMKYAGWWMGCKLAGIREVIVGEKPLVNSHKFRNSPKSATVVAVKSLKVDDLPKMSNGFLYWKPEKFTYFLYRFLSEVKTTLDSVPEGTLFIAELPSSDARSIKIHLEKHGQSELDYFHQELVRRISNYL